MLAEVKRLLAEPDAWSPLAAAPVACVSAGSTFLSSLSLCCWPGKCHQTQTGLKHMPCSFYPACNNPDHVNQLHTFACLLTSHYPGPTEEKLSLDIPTMEEFQRRADDPEGGIQAYHAKKVLCIDGEQWRTQVNNWIPALPFP